jgi:MFS family permease
MVNGLLKQAVARSLGQPYRVMVGFFLLGLMFGSWVPRIPAVKASIHLSSGTLGFELLAPALGAILAMIGAGALVATYGSRTVLRIATLLLAIPAVFIGLANTKSELFLALLVWGAGSGSADVALNSQGVLIQAVSEKLLMPTFHGMFSLGALFGGICGSFAAGFGMPVSLQLGITGFVVLVVGELTTFGMLAGSTPGIEKNKRFVRPDRQLLLLGLFGFAALVCEGAASDWSAVYLRIHLSVSAGVAGLAYVVFAVAMITMRLAGHRVIDRYGGKRMIVISSSFGAVFFAAGLAIDSVVSVLVGFAALGMGLACCAPLAIGAAGQRSESGPSVATVTTMSYFGLLAGPPVIGALAGALGLTKALYLVPLMAVVCAAIASFRNVNFGSKRSSSER